jgi:hypothetical protein
MLSCTNRRLCLRAHGVRAQGFARVQMIHFVLKLVQQVYEHVLGEGRSVALVHVSKKSLLAPLWVTGLPATF